MVPDGGAGVDRGCSAEISAVDRSMWTGRGCGGKVEQAWLREREKQDDEEEEEAKHRDIGWYA